MANPPPPPPPPRRGGPEDATYVEETTEPYPRGRQVVVDEAPPRRDPWGWLAAALFAALAIVFFVLWWTTRDNADTERVPNLVGMQAAQARTEAQARGFDVKSVQRSAGSPAGTVVDQGPGSGAHLEQGAKVLIVVSSGKSQVDVPDVTGMKAADAQQQLVSAGLKAKVQSVPSQKPAGTVLAQNPSGGDKAAKDSEVLLSVSSGPKQATVPALVGLSVENATAKLAAVGLVARVVRVSSPQKEGNVIAQDPQPKQKVTAGSAVRINVSSGPTATTPSTVTVVTATTATVATTAPVP